MIAPALSPKGQARAAAEAAQDKAWQAEIAERNELQSAQATNAANIRIGKLARKMPIVADLLEEYNALKATVATLRAQQTELERQHAELSHEYTSQASEKAALQIERDELLGHVKAISARADKAEADVAKLGQDLDAARSDAGKARAELAKLRDRKT